MRELVVAVQNDNVNVNPMETIDAIDKAGFKNVFIQWYDKDWEYSQEEQLERIRELGLNIVFAHLGYQNINAIWEEGEIGDKLVERYQKNIKDCKKNRISLVIMHLTSGMNPPIYNELGLQRIKKIVDYAEEMDVKIAFENTKIKGYLEYVFDNIANKNIGLCYDAGHCHAHFKDEFPYERYKEKILAVHLHDNDQTDDLHLLPWDGTIDWEFVINKLKECNYTGPVTLELCYRYDYVKMTLKEFYQKGYEIGKRLAEIFEKE